MKPAYIAIIVFSASLPLAFAVEFTTDASIQLLIPRPSYVPNDMIQIMGFYHPNTIIHLDLVDPNGITTNSTLAQSDNLGNFQEKIVIPSDAINGTWKINATSGPVHHAISLTVISQTAQYVTTGPPPVMHMELKPSSQVYQKGDFITISGKEDNYLIQNNGNNLTLSIDDARTKKSWCCDTFQSSQQGIFYYSFKMPDILQDQDYYNIRVNSGPNDQYGVGIMYYNILPNPLVQQRLGISTLDVECRDGFIHAIKSEDQSAACVREQTLDSLVKRGWTTPYIISSKRTSHIVLPPFNPINLSSPCQTQYVEKPSVSSPVYPNGTIITTDYVPVLYMSQNSTGVLCVNYDSSQPNPASIRIFEASNMSRDANFSHYASPDTILQGNSTVAYTISTNNQSGFYGISFSCGGFPFAVGYNNQSRITTDDFPWYYQVFHCGVITYNYKISGLTGIGVYQIKTISHEQLDYDIQNTTVDSYSTGINGHNATFSMHVRTFDKPVRFWFDYKDSMATKFATNPGFKIGSDACNWDVTENNQDQSEPWLRIDGIHVKESPVIIPAHSNGTYTFSILAENLADGYYGLNPVIHGATTDISSDNAGTNYIAYNFPIETGIGNKILDFTGTCMK